MSQLYCFLNTVKERECLQPECCVERNPLDGKQSVWDNPFYSQTWTDLHPASATQMESHLTRQSLEKTFPVTIIKEYPYNRCWSVSSGQRCWKKPCCKDVQIPSYLLTFPKKDQFWPPKHCANGTSNTVTIINVTQVPLNRGICLAHTPELLC